MASTVLPGLVRQHQLHGRAPVLGIADRVLRRAVATGRAALLVVSGEGGIGKTAFLREVCGSAGTLGFAVGVGRAEESDQLTPLAAVLSALRSGREPLLSRDAFARLAPTSDQQLWTIDRLADELDAVAARRPVLICVDDVQWADPSTVHALSVLPVRLAESPIVWVIATRPGPPRAERVAAAAGADLEVERIVLEPLDATAVRALAADRLGAAAGGDRVRRLLRDAGGVPFLAVALLDGLAAHGDTAGGEPGPAGDGRVELPGSLVLGVRHRLASLSVGSRDLVRAGSVLGRAFDVADVAALLDGSPAEVVLPWLEATVRAGVLDDTGAQIVFRHDLLRQAVYADVPPSLRLALHRRAVRHLVDRGRPPLQVAPHVLHGATPGDLAAVDLLRRAAGESTVPATSADLAHRAWSLLTPGSPQRGEAGLEAVRRLHAADRSGDAMHVADTVLASAAGPELVARVQIEVAHAMWRRGELDQLADRVESASRLPGLAAGTGAHLQALTALARSHDDDPAAAVRSARHALEQGVRAHDAAAQTTALHALGEIARNDGRNDDALTSFRRMRRVSGTEYFHDEVLSLQLLDRFDESGAMLAEAEARAAAAGRISYPPDVSFGLMWQSFNRGRLDETEINAHALLRIGDELRQFTFHSEARILLSRVAQLRGDLPTAREQVRLAEEHVNADTSQALMIAVAHAWSSTSEGDDSAAAAAVRSVMTPPNTRHHRWLWQPGWLLPALLVALAADDRALAVHVAARTVTLRDHNPEVLSNAALADCALGLVTGDTALLVTAADLARRGPRAILRAQILTALGRAQLRDGDRTPGVTALNEAWDVYTGVGAHGEARRVQRLLQAAGVRRRNWTPRSTRPLTGWSSLTDSEQRVAGLIAAGHTNRSAAATLVLSPNTVATHLRAVYTKLGVGSRVQLSLAAAAADAVGTGPNG